MKKYSMLSLSLLAVSAITAAFIPAKKSAAAGMVANNGHITFSTGGQANVTCRIPLEEDALNCDYSLTKWRVGGVSATSAVGVPNSKTAINGVATGTGTTGFIQL